MSWEGLLGVVVGAGLTQLKDLGLAKRKERSAREYLVARISVQLELFATRCANVADDWGDPDTTGQGEPDWSPREQLPSLSFESVAVDWTVLPHDLLRDLLRLPIRIAEEDAAISIFFDHFSDPPLHVKVFAERTQRFGRLGIEALTLSGRLRSLLRLSSRDPESTALEQRIRAALEYSTEKQISAEPGGWLHAALQSDALNALPESQEP